MASGLDVKTVSTIPLNGKHFPTWKVLCRMALMMMVSGELPLRPKFSDKSEDLAKLVA